MYLEPFFLAGIGIVFGCLVLILIAIAVLYLRANKGLNALETEFTLYKRDHETKAQEALDAAIRKGQEIIASTQMFSDETRRKVMDSVSKSVATGSVTYQQIIADLGQKSVNELLLYSDTLKKSIESEVNELTTNFKSQLKTEETAFHSSLQKSETEVFTEIQKKAAALLPEILKEACKRSITSEEADALVLSSLQKIKKQHGFS